MTHSFPTRRSSDLNAVEDRHAGEALQIGQQRAGQIVAIRSAGRIGALPSAIMAPAVRNGDRPTRHVFRDHHGRPDRTRRSEEHTSELQSLMRISYAVFCLKKKNKITKN